MASFLEMCTYNYVRYPVRVGPAFRIHQFMDISETSIAGSEIGKAGVHSFSVATLVS
jgi:hypothetical protein